MKTGVDRESAIDQEFADRRDPALWWALVVSIILHLLFLSIMSLGRPGSPGELYMVEGGVIDLAAQTGGEDAKKIFEQAKTTAPAKPLEKEQPVKEQPKPKSEVITSAKGVEKLAAKPSKKESQESNPAADSQSPGSKGTGEKSQTVEKGKQVPGEMGKSQPAQPEGKEAVQGAGSGAGTGSGTGTGGFGTLDGPELMVLGKAIVYPKNAQNEGVTGTVILRLFVKADGAVEKVVLEKSSGDVRLDAQAVKTLASQSFRPAAQNYTMSLKIAFEAGGVVSVSNNK
ncbi:MAG: energy transducer TonB [Syntrophothermus sp.]